MKRMGGFVRRTLRWSRNKLNTSILTSFIFLLILLNVNLTNCKKAVRTVDKVGNEVSYKQVPLPWSQDSGVQVSKSYPPLEVTMKPKKCGKSNSKLSSKCRKEQKKIDRERLKFIQKHSEKFNKKNLSDNFHAKMIKHGSGSGWDKNGLPEIPDSLQNVQNLTTEVILDINKFIKKKRHYCKIHEYEGWYCQKLKLSTWLAKQMERNRTSLNPWLEIVKRPENETGVVGRSFSKDLRDVQPDSWPEKIAYRLIKNWGDPEDLFVFYKYKDFVKSRELKICLPYQVELKVSPRSSSEMEESARSGSASSMPTYSLAMDSPRIFWDPGFNLKLKLPFFRDELKVAVSTGPSFVAGIGVGIALLIVKSMFAPFLLGLKWMMYNVFFKESSPFELMKMLFLSHAPDSWESAPIIPPPSIEHYAPPPVHNHFDHRPMGHPPREPPPPHHRPSFRNPFHRGPKGFRPPPPPPHYHHHGPHGPGPGHGHGHGPSSSYEIDHHYSMPPFDLSHQYTQSTPMIQSLSEESPTMSQLEHMYRAQLLHGGMSLRRPGYKSLLPPDPTNALDDGMGMDPMSGGGMSEQEPHDSQSYIPSTGLQAEVEHFDPFYSPLLSKIDSIFTHLGHEDEGCRERVVCSIYKFPVKYAPYSNLLSAQLSKHQSELKRPVTSSPKILRYFRYMKAAKDGQGGENCIELYPKCNSDTDAVSSLPMITTFHQLSELMTAESSSPVAAIVAAG